MESYEEYSFGPESFVIFPMEKDGNCLFRAMAFFVFNNPNRHHEIRSKLVSYIADNWHIFQNYSLKDMEKYRGKMIKPGTFGGDIEIFAFTKFFNCSFKVFYKHRPKSFPTLYGDSVPQCTSLFSGSWDAGHYDVILPSNKSKMELLLLKREMTDLRKRASKEFEENEQ
ncbi:hypothetical protein AVEN_92082-1 [Araneus ventricosus]|uniref:OTU domain-containing protein n=1 Tax=Araneus ventricosus TaxID=182803 RepID=A0A4Y2QWN6_ARAVE|nr:hypothetical protein AVEN_92082-1 [Araneus ventricosus]